MERHHEIPQLILIGIAYGALPQHKGNYRVRDYTPTRVADYSESGGADRFLSFIREELIPFVNSNYRIDPSDQTILGGSFGGLFAHHVLFHDPRIFIDTQS